MDGIAINIERCEVLKKITDRWVSAQNCTSFIVDVQSDAVGLAVSFVYLLSLKLSLRDLQTTLTVINTNTNKTWKC